MGLHIELHKWEEAFELAKKNPQLQSLLYLPYAEWLSSNDKFDEAQRAYKQAGRPDLSLRIVEFLTQGAVTEKRFQDAAQYFWLLGSESLKLVKDAVKPSREDMKYMRQYNEYIRMAEIYQAYHLVNRVIEDPYQSVIADSQQNENIFNAARFLINAIGKRSPAGVSKVYIYYALSFLGTKFEAFKTARFGYEKLQTLKIPLEWQEEIDMSSLRIRSKPFSDNSQYNPICNRCMNPNALINSAGDFCSACGQPFVRSFIGFDTMPFVEFQPHESIPYSKVIDLLKQDPPEEEGSNSRQPRKPKGPTAEDQWRENMYGDQQTLTFQNQEYPDDIENDPFTQRMLEWLETQVTADSYRPVMVDEHILLSMKYEDVREISFERAGVCR